jgi:hypothetical protein
MHSRHFNQKEIAPPGRSIVCSIEQNLNNQFLRDWSAYLPKDKTGLIVLIRLWPTDITQWAHMSMCFGNKSQELTKIFPYTYSIHITCRQNLQGWNLCSLFIDNLTFKWRSFQSIRIRLFHSFKWSISIPLGCNYLPG